MAQDGKERSLSQGRSCGCLLVGSLSVCDVMILADCFPFDVARNESMDVSYGVAVLAMRNFRLRLHFEVLCTKLGIAMVG